MQRSDDPTEHENAFLLYRIASFFKYFAGIVLFVDGGAGAIRHAAGEAPYPGYGFQFAVMFAGCLFVLTAAFDLGRHAPMSSDPTSPRGTSAR